MRSRGSFQGFAVYFSFFAVSAFLAQAPQALAQDVIESAQQNAEGLEVRALETVSINGVPYSAFQFQNLKLKPLESKCPSASQIDAGSNFGAFDKTVLAVNIAGDFAAALGTARISEKHDKVRHVLAGYVVGNVATGTFQLLLPKDMKNRKLVSALLGLGTSVLVGIGKEVYDASSGKRFDPKDALATGLGGVSGTLTISLTDLRRFTRKNRAPAVLPVQR